jgi:drug/metabolite transporter (DMT)-like permease
MLYLALHIVGNASFLLLVRVGRGPRYDYPLVGLANYATATALAALALAWQGPPAPDVRAALLGATNGAQYQTTYILMFTLYGLLGVAATTGLLRLSVVVPVLASVLLWGEWPTAAQGVGLLLAACALPLLSARPAGSSPRPPSGPARPHWAPTSRPGESPRRPALALAVLTVLISGAGLLAAKAFAELELPAQRPVYVLATYAAAMLLGCLAWPWRARFQQPAAGLREGDAGGALPGPGKGAGIGRRRRGPSLALGVVVGTVNIAQIWALLAALAQVPGVLAFPLSAAGGLALSTLGARLLWQERVGPRAGAGIGLAMLAAILGNLG